MKKLEVLLLLSVTPHQWWNAIDVARALHRQTSSVEIHLQDLTIDGLFAKRAGESTIYCYSPGCATLKQTVRSLARAYHEKKDTVIELIFSSPLNDPFTESKFIGNEVSENEVRENEVLVR